MQDYQMDQFYLRAWAHSWRRVYMSKYVEAGINIKGFPQTFSTVLFETGSFFVTWGSLRRLKASPRDLTVPPFMELRLEVWATTTGSLCCCGLDSNSHASLTNTTSWASFPVLQTENYIHSRFLFNFLVHEYFTCMYVYRTHAGLVSTEVR